MKKLLTALLLVMMSLVAITLTGCGPTYANIKVSASYLNQEEGYLSLIVGQEETVVFTVSQLPSRATPNLTFSKDSNIISSPEVVSTNKEKGTTTVKIKALSAGNATLRAIAEGGNYYELQIRATLAINDFTVKDDVALFAVRGQNNPKILKLDSSIFNFYPAETSQKEIIFKDKNDNVITEIDANDFPNETQIAIYATSPYLSKRAEIKVSLIDEIGIVNVYEHTSTADILLTSAEQADDQNPSDNILFITNRSAFSRKIVQVVVANNQNNLLRVNRIIKQQVLDCTDFDILRTYHQNGNTIFEFELQSLQEGQTTIQFEVFYLGYESYVISRTFEVLIKNAPDQILMNDIEQENNVEITLYDSAYSTVFTTQYVSIIPTTAIYDTIEIGYDLTELGDETATMNQYINFTVGGLPLGQTITNLNAPIVAKGIKPTGGKQIALIIKLTWGEKYGLDHGEGALYYRLNFVVKTGADSLRLHYDYSPSEGIYIKNDGITREFTGLYVQKPEAHTDNPVVIPFNQGAALYAQVEPSKNQPLTPDQKSKLIPLQITPLAVGSGKWRVILPNGVYCDLVIHVIGTMDKLLLDFDEYNSSPTSTRKYDSNNSLTEINVKLAKSGNEYTASLKLNFTTTPVNYDLTNTKLYEFTTTVAQATQTSSFEFNRATGMLSMKTNINGFSTKVLDYQLVVKKVDNFKLKSLWDFTVGSPEYRDFVANNIFRGSLTVGAYVPLTSVGFSQREVSLYPEQMLGFYYKDLSQQISVLQYSPNEISPLFENMPLNVLANNIEISLSSSISDYIEGNTLQIPGYGSYNYKTGVIELSVAPVVYEPFYIYVNISYYDELFTSSLKVIPLQYQSVNSVRLSNYVGKRIYLDPTHAHQDIFTYILPAEAVHKELRYTFVPDDGYSASIVKLENATANSVRISYNNQFPQIGLGGKGHLVISPTASIMDPSITPPNALEIPVEVGAGSLENPFLINTAQELINIGTSGYDKHYKLETTIDLSNTNFTTLGVFRGSIDGVGKGKIIGLNISKLFVDENTNYAYGGLFQKIEPQKDGQTPIANTGVIKNLIIEGTINLTTNMRSSIGIVAGELGAGAVFENVTVILNQSTLTIATNQELKVGGVVGVNSGTIKNIIGVDSAKQIKYANYPSVIMKGEFKVVYTLQTDQTRSYFGGIVGTNDEGGQIKRITASKIKLYNEDNHMANVLMSISGATSVSNSSEKLAFSVGAFAGKNAGIIKGERLDGGELDSATFYDYAKATGKIELFQANNRLGGLVGENLGTTAALENSVSRVKLIGKGNGASNAYLGGLFGYNDAGTIKNCVIQALEDGISLGTSVSLIYSQVFGITQGENPTLDGKVNIYGYDRTALAVHENSHSFVINNKLQSLTYVGGVEQNGEFPQGKRRFEPNITAFATLNNYYGDFLVGSIGKMFTPASAELLFDDEKTENPMVSTTSNVKMAYLYYHKAVDSANQGLINSYNIYQLPFDFTGEINLYSFDSSIISIGSDGFLTVRSTGLVKIRVLSALNAKISQDVYIYVVHATDNFVLYEQNTSQENILDAGKVVKVYSGQTVPVYVVYGHENLVLTGYEVALVSGQEYTIVNLQQYEEGFVKTAQLVSIGSMYGFEAINHRGSTTFAIFAQIQLINNGHVFTSGNLTSAQGTPVSYTFRVEHATGASGISSNTDTILVEPSDKFNFNIAVQTDDFDEKIEITTTKLENNQIKQGDYFDIKETNRIYTIGMSNSFPTAYYEKVENGKLTLKITQKSQSGAQITKAFELEFLLPNRFIKLESASQFAQTISFDMAQIFGVFADQQYIYEFLVELEQVDGLEYSIIDGLLLGTSLSSYITLTQIQSFYQAQFNAINQNNYAGTYYINTQPTSTLAEGMKKMFATVTVIVNAQSITGVTFDSFVGSTKDDINSGKEQSIYVDPQSQNPNHFRISITPSYADYDYIEIFGQNQNIKVLLTLIDENGNNKFGATLTNNGIRIAKDKVTSTMFVKYAISSIGVANGQVIPFALVAYKDQQIVYAVEKQIVVKFTKDVTFDIENRDETQEFVFLTRGSRYRFTIQSNGYAQDEIFMSTNRPDIISIDKTNRTITVTSNPIVYSTNNLLATIEIFGSKTVGGEVISSSPYSVNVMVVDYYIIPTDEHTIIKNGSNGVVSLALGNTYTLSTQLLADLTVEYNTSITSIAQSIATFENSLNQKGTWQYQMGVLNQDGTYSYSNSWTTISGSVSTVQSNGYFTITKTSGEYIFTPLKVTSTQNPAYKFRFNYGYDYKNGLAEYSPTLNFKQQEFLFNIYQVSSMDTPTPVYTIEEFVGMNPGVYYILMNDLVLPSTFQPISTAIAGFDGNGNKLIITNNLSVNDMQRVGIFSTIQKGSLIRNLTIQIASSVRLTINQTNPSSVYVGLLAGENNGMISNVAIETMSGASYRVVFTGDQVSSINYVGGLVGINNGYITNSRAVLSLTASANLAGFVGYNVGKISSSYVDNSLIINTSTEAQNKTAGFVVYNSTASASGGQITMCYVTGLHTGTIALPIYANSTSKVLRSSTETAGFVYENNGNINNSYSNIPIQTSSKSAGFVYINKGTISNTFSTSMMKSNSQESYGYVYDNSSGTLQNNFYLTDIDINFSINTSNEFMDKNMLKPLNKSEFTKPETLKQIFSTFSITNANSITKGVWFVPDAMYQSQFNNQGKIFVVNRLELVSPNLVATSRLAVDIGRTTQDETTGATTYYYVNVGPYPQGSIYNPYLLTNANEFEQRILLSNASNINTNYYRLVADIDYEADNVSSTRLFSTILTGDIEGNGFEIRGYVIDSSISTTSSGLFAKIGNGSSQQGSVKNIVLKPKYINMPNSIAVGGLAGTLDAGALFNIKVDGFGYSNNGIVVLGRNIVGGVVGRALGNFLMFNIQSSVSTNATYRSNSTLGQALPTSQDQIASYFLFRSHLVSTLSKFSYAGTVAGVMAGTGSVWFVQTNGVIASMAEFASLAFGGVGDGVEINNVSVNLVQGSFIQPAVYGGFVAGEFFGRLNNAQVQSSNILTNIIKTIPFKPYAVGGLVGLMGNSVNLSVGNESSVGGVIKNSAVKTSILLDNVKVVGGIVGELIGAHLSNKEELISLQNTTFSGSLQSEETVGGIVGRVATRPSAPILLSNSTYALGLMYSKSGEFYHIANKISVSGGSITVNNDNNGAANVGGIVGQISLYKNSSALIKITNATNANEIMIISDIYGSKFDIYAGGLVGQLTKGQYTVSQTADQSELTLKDCSFTSRIAIVLRDLDHNSPSALTDDSEIYKIHYGKLVANQDSKTIEGTDPVKKQFVVLVGENITYVNNGTAITTGSVSNNTSDYLLLKYTQDSGALVEFDQNLETTPGQPKIFVEFEVEGQTAK